MKSVIHLNKEILWYASEAVGGKKTKVYISPFTISDDDGEYTQDILWDRINDAIKTKGYTPYNIDWLTKHVLYWKE